MSSLIIVESPTKAKTLSKFLGRDYRIEATMGHIRDLPESTLGITITTVDNVLHFEPKYQPIKDRKTKITELKKFALEANKIILATDPDREGEAIAFHVQNVIASAGKKSEKKDPHFNEKFVRIVFHEITKSAIDHALLNPRMIDIPLVDAQQARRILDRLVGYKLSPLLWNKLGKRWLSAGRVQSVAVRLIVEREREIKAFQPIEYWVIEVELQKEKETKKFLAKLIEVDGKKSEVGDKNTADALVAGLSKAAYQVTKVEKREVRRFPVPPFTTSTLQQAAANKYGWSAKRTMRAAQNLYEEGHITYHRTDSTNLAAEAITMVRTFIPQTFGSEFLSDEVRIYKTKSKVAQEAHEAIRPTNVTIVGSFDLKKISENGKNNSVLTSLPVELGRDADLLYSLIWKRFVACQMKEAVFDQTSIQISAGSYLLRASGQTPKFPGWLTIYSQEKSEEEKSDGEEENKELPLVREGEPLTFVGVVPSQKFTEPPPRFNEASLIKALEEKGIGRPSTYAPIISTIQDRKYVEKIERKFFPTDLGISVNDFLIKYFSDIFDISFTAHMEDELDEVANGALSWEKVLGDFYAPFSSKLDEVFKTAQRVKVDLGTTDEKCPQCGAPLAIRISKFGKFLACSTYPTCKFTKNIVEKVGIACPKCGADMVVKKTRRGKQFYGCSAYPTCTFAAWKKEDIK